MTQDSENGGSGIGLWPLPSFQFPRYASLILALAPGCATGCYLAAGGYYIKLFNDRIFLNAMTFCIWAPQPLMSLLQHVFDDRIDDMLTTRVSYFFRVIMMQLTIAAIMIIWGFVTPVEWVIVLIGLAIGTVTGAIVSSSLQLTTAINPARLVNAKLGMQGGGAALSALFLAVNISPSSSSSSLRTVIFVVGAVAVFVAVVLSFLHFYTNTFDKAYERLGYDSRLNSRQNSPHTSMDSSRQASPLYDEASSLLGNDQLGPDMERQLTPTKSFKKSDDPDEPIPHWIWYWITLNGLMNAVAYFMASLSGFYGSAAFAQTLTILKLICDFSGRFVALSIPHLPAFNEGPFHKVMITIFVVVMSCFGVSLARLLTGDVGPNSVFGGVFMFCWCMLFFLTMIGSSLLDVTSGFYVEVQERKKVARTNQLVVVLSILLGLILAAVPALALIEKDKQHALIKVT